MDKANTLRPQGTWEVRRTIRVPTLDATGAPSVVAALEALPGVRKALADVRKHLVVLRYDSTAADYRSILTVLHHTGYPALNSWWANIKGSWYQFIDSNARENAKLPPPSCCNKPPK